MFPSVLKPEKYVILIMVTLRFIGRLLMMSYPLCACVSVAQNSLLSSFESHVSDPLSPPWWFSALCLNHMKDFSRRMLLGSSAPANQRCPVSLKSVDQSLTLNVKLSYSVFLLGIISWSVWCGEEETSRSKPPVPLTLNSIPPSLPLPGLTRSSQVLDLGGDLDVGFRGQGETASLADAIAHQGDVLLEALGVPREAQHRPSGLGQRCGLVLGAPRQAAPQEVGDGSVAALLPALRRQEEDEEPEYKCVV